VKKDISNEEWTPKNNDLYQFHQTSLDLKSSEKESLRKLRSVIYSHQMREFFSSVCDVKLNNTVDMSASQYRYGDTLLCHDDRLKGRKVAYIIYLVEDWEEEDGGALQLFENVRGEPKEVRTSIVPRWNQMAFFKVTDVSFHTVQQVLSREKTRMAISGWYHGPGESVEKKGEVCEKASLVPRVRFRDDDGVDLEKWINPVYLYPALLEEMIDYFHENSAINLNDILLPDK